MSVDGHIDDLAEERLTLSNAADLDRVDAVRATMDAIMVGAGTVRRDNPSLLVKSVSRRIERVSRGLPEDLVKVTVTEGGDLDPGSRFFTTGAAPKLVYTVRDAAAGLTARLGSAATVVDLGERVDLPALLADLSARGVRRLMVEGGGAIHTAFLTAGLADELHLVVAPFFIGEPDAPRFTHAGAFPQSPRHPMRLAEVRKIGEVALLRYTMGRA